MAKRYYWIKLKEDFFTRKEIKKLRRISGGDTFTIIYLKLQLLSLKNEGTIYFDGLEDSFCEELALTLDEDTEDVQATLSFLEKCGLLSEKSDTEYLLTEVPELIGSESDKAEIMRKKRSKDKQLSGNNVTAELPPVTFCYTEIEKELEQDKDTDTDIHIDRKLELEELSEINSENNSDSNPDTNEYSDDVMYFDSNSNPDTSPNSNECEDVVRIFNSLCPSLRPVGNLTETRRGKILTAKKSVDLRSLFERVEKSDFLTGRNGNWYSGGEKSANFDWILKPENIAKIQSGIYDNRDFDANPKTNYCGEISRQNSGKNLFSGGYSGSRYSTDTFSSPQLSSFSDDDIKELIRLENERLDEMYW